MPSCKTWCAGLLLACASSAEKTQQYKLKIPRVTLEELANSEELLAGHWPYVLTGFLDEWPAMEKWKDLDYLQTKMSEEFVDYYPENMYNLGNKPFMLKFEDALKKMRVSPSPTRKPRYMQCRISLDTWEGLMPDMLDLPPTMWTEKDWIYKCMPNRKDIDNFLRVNQWNMMLIGEEGTGIFFHHDHLAASSWQAHIVGRKEWVVCPYDQGERFPGTPGPQGLHTFEPDYEDFPGFRDANCGKVTAQPGELLYYPAYWWHQTKCLDTPTIGVTGLMVGVEDNRADIEYLVHDKFKQDILKKCRNPGEDISKKWPGAAPPISKGACKALDACYDLWHENFKKIDFKYSTDNSHADHTAKAIEFDEAGDLSGAVASFRAATKFLPQKAEVWGNLATVLLDEANPEAGSKANKKEAAAAEQRAARIEEAEESGEDLEEQEL